MPVTTPDAPLSRAARRQERGGAQNSKRFRGDIEGLRALAVLLVLIYHAGFSRLSGGFVGVDVFFVVSGFVITNQLLREVESTGRLSLLGFYGRRAKRLLPAAGAVIVVTALMSWLLVNRVQWQQIGGDLVGAAAYVVNWVFAQRSVDYLAEDVDPSPVLHFWSLAVEEQFYVVWPLIILGLILFLRRRTVRAAGPEGLPEGFVVVPERAHLAIGLLALIVVPSLIFSAVYTYLSPAQAFFITPTRLWELGVGALVALGSGVFLTWRARLGALVGWCGLIVLVASAFLVSTATPWPGIAALAPVLGTAAVIAGGFACRDAGPARLLALRPLVWIGGLSYSLYLWHWPMLRFWEWQFGVPSLTQGLLIVAASFLPAWWSYRLIESPIRHAKSLNISPRYALSVGFNFTLVALVAGLLLMQAGSAGTAAGKPTGANWGTGDSVSSTADPGSSTTDPGGDTSDPTGAPSPDDHDGASEPATGLPLPSVEGPGDEPFFDQVTPNPLTATQDVPALYDTGCQSSVEEVEVKVCEMGDPEGETLLAVVGDSKAGQWTPALDLIAKEQGWRLHVFTKSACAFGPAPTVADGAVYTGCQTWSAEVLDRLLTVEHPDAVLVSSVRAHAVDEQEEPSVPALVDGYVDYWTQLEQAGIPVIALSDTPQPGDGATPYECAADHPDDASTACTWSSDDGIGSEPLKAAVKQVDGASYIDMNPWVCPEGTCSAVYRNVLTYRQGSHITATLAEVLAEPLAAYLVPLVEASGTG